MTAKHTVVVTNKKQKPDTVVSNVCVISRTDPWWWVWLPRKPVTDSLCFR